MSTHKKIDPIRQLLDELKPESAQDSLWKSHVSAMLSYERMLAYIDKTGPSQGEQPEFTDLVRAYKKMARKFYSEYEKSLTCHSIYSGLCRRKRIMRCRCRRR